MDNQGRIIGSSRNLFQYSSRPLDLEASAEKNTTEIDSAVTLNVEMTLKHSLSKDNNEKIKIILPYSDNYDYLKISCVALTLDLNCVSTLTSDGTISVLVN